jgi:hypothetical protein
MPLVILPYLLNFFFFLTDCRKKLERLTPARFFLACPLFVGKVGACLSGAPYGSVTLRLGLALVTNVGPVQKCDQGQTL